MRSPALSFGLSRAISVAVWNLEGTDLTGSILDGRQLQPVVDLESITACHDRRAAVARVVRGDHRGARPGGLGEHPLAGRRRGPGSTSNAHGSAGRALDGAVGQIADEDRGLPASSHTSDDPGVCPVRAAAAATLISVVVGPELHLVFDRYDAVLEHHGCPRIRPRSRRGVARLVRVEVPVVRLRQSGTGRWGTSAPIRRRPEMVFHPTWSVCRCVLITTSTSTGSKPAPRSRAGSRCPDDPSAASWAGRGRFRRRCPPATVRPSTSITHVCMAILHCVCLSQNVGSAGRRCPPTPPAVSPRTATGAVSICRLHHAGDGGVAQLDPVSPIIRPDADLAGRPQPTVVAVPRSIWAGWASTRCRTCAANPSPGPSRATGTSPSRARAAAGR